MHGEKLCPAHAALAALRRGFQVMTAEDIAHGQLVDAMPQIRQGSLDPPIAPGRMLFGHLDGEPLDLLRHWGPPQLCPARAAVELLRDQALVPA